MPVDEYLIPVAFSTMGLLCGLQRDIADGNGQRHVFYATRQAYLLMYLYLVMRWLGYSSETTPWLGTLLHIAAPASISVFFTFHVCVIFMAKFDPTSAASFASHLMMPTFAVLEYTWDRSEPAWWMAVLVMPLALMMAHLAMQLLFWWLVCARSDNVYPEYPVPGKRGVLAAGVGILGMVAVAAAHTLLDAYDVPRPEWLVTTYMSLIVSTMLQTLVLVEIRRRRALSDSGAYEIVVENGNADEELAINN